MAGFKVGLVALCTVQTAEWQHPVVSVQEVCAAERQSAAPGTRHPIAAYSRLHPVHHPSPVILA